LISNKVFFAEAQIPLGTLCPDRPNSCTPSSNIPVDRNLHEAFCTIDRVSLCPLFCKKVILSTNPCRLPERMNENAYGVCTADETTGKSKYVDTGQCSQMVSSAGSDYHVGDQEKKVMEVLREKYKLIAERTNVDADELIHKYAAAIMIEKLISVREEYFFDWYAMYVLRFKWGLGARLDETPCINTPHWHGVKCNEDYTISELDFSWSKITDYHGELMEVEIPQEITFFKKLKKFTVERNALTGTIPTDIGNLVDLYEFNVSSNKMTGSLPESFYNLEKLRYVSLANNMFRGQLTNEVAGLEDLVAMNLYNNKFYGTLPYELGNLQNLEYFTAHENNIQGSCGQALCRKKNIVVTINCVKIDFCEKCGSVNCKYS